MIWWERHPVWDFKNIKERGVRWGSVVDLGGVGGVLLALYERLLSQQI